MTELAPPIDQSRPDAPFWLCNARLVLPDRVALGALKVEGRHIVDVVTEAGSARTQGTTDASREPSRKHTTGSVIDMAGDYVLPGLVELHTDNLERHMQPRPSVFFPHGPAILAHDGEVASVGITTVFDALRVGSDEGAASTQRYARAVATKIADLRRADGLKIRHLLHLRAEVCSDTLIEELAEFAPEDRIRLISLMDHTPGQRQFRDLSKLRQYHVGKHAISEAAFVEMVDSRLERRRRIGDAHDRATVAAATRLGAVLASHDDTTSDDVAASLENGARISEFPTTTQSARACRAGGQSIVMGAPNLLRGGSHSGNVAAVELAQAGLLDILSSDYVPSSLLRGAFQLAELWQDLPRAVATVTANPAAAVDLTDRGRIVPGLLADLVRVRLVEETPVVGAVWCGGERVG